jgi:hypothetical protein
MTRVDWVEQKLWYAVNVPPDTTERHILPQIYHVSLETLVRGAVLVNSMITLQLCDVVIQENLMIEVSGCDGCNEDSGWYL